MNIVRFLMLALAGIYCSLIFANDKATETTPTEDSKIVFSIPAGSKEDLVFKLSAKLLNEISKKTGEEIELTILPPDKAKLMLEAGRIDAEIARIKEYAKPSDDLIMANEPVATIPFYAYSTNKEIDVTIIDGLRNLRVVSVKGQIYSNVLFKEHILFNADSVKSGLLHLYQDKADIFVTDGLTAFKISQAIDTNELGIYRLEPPIAVTNVYTFFNSKHSKFAKKYEKALIEIKKEGIYEKIYKEQVIDKPM